MPRQPKVGDTVTIIDSPPYKTKIIRITPKYVVVDNGSKYRIIDGKPSGMARGRLQMPFDGDDSNDVTK